MSLIGKSSLIPRAPTPPMPPSPPPRSSRRSGRRIAPAAVVNGADPDGVEGAAEPPYAFPAIRVEFQQVEPRHMPTGWWRGVGPTCKVFVVESFIDDPVALKRA